jgi:hypothetical protein
VQHHPAALNGVLEFGEPARACLLISNGNGPFTFSIWMRPSCAASTPLAISISLRAAVSGPTAGWLQRITSCLQDILVIGTAGGCQVGSVYLYYHGCPKTDAPGSRW